MLKKGTSFELVLENRLFSGADSYTLTISFPLKDCPENIKIFGHINRKDVIAKKVILECYIDDPAFKKKGAVTITEIDNVEAKCQFLEGRSAQNFDRTLDSIYINELQLGQPADVSIGSLSPADCYRSIEEGAEAVALPWVRNKDKENIQNNVDWDETAKKWKWHVDKNQPALSTEGLSFQPFLIVIAKRIAKAAGITMIDFTEWENKPELLHLLICNTLPYAWYQPQYARALPRWSVKEFFEKLELFLDGQFDFDLSAGKITFKLNQSVFGNKAKELIENVLDEYTTEVKVGEEQAEYLHSKNLKYKDCDHDMWKFYSCDWFSKQHAFSKSSYRTVSELISDAKHYRKWNPIKEATPAWGTPMSNIFHADEVNMDFVLHTVSRKDGGKTDFGWKTWDYLCTIVPINEFGGRIVNQNEGASEEEIEFVPAWIDWTERGNILYLDTGNYVGPKGLTIQGSGFTYKWNWVEISDFEAWMETPTGQALENGANEGGTAEFYDRIYVGIWDGPSGREITDPNDDKGVKKIKALEKPFVSRIDIEEGMESWAWYGRNSLSLKERVPRKVSYIHKIENKQKTTFKFLSDRIPDSQAVFNIKGKRYLCAKITATCRDTGISQLLKGEFYEITDGE